MSIEFLQRKGQAIRAARKEAGLTQKQCAKDCNMSPQLWSKYEKGHVVGATIIKFALMEKYLLKAGYPVKDIGEGESESRTHDRRKEDKEASKQIPLFG